MQPRLLRSRTVFERNRYLSKERSQIECFEGNNSASSHAIPCKEKSKIVADSWSFSSLTLSCLGNWGEMCMLWYTQSNRDTEKEKLCFNLRLASFDHCGFSHHPYDPFRGTDQIRNKEYNILLHDCSLNPV